MALGQGTYDVILLDLDGTIIDSEPGIQSALRHALVTGFGIAPTTQELEEFMGPPLDDVLPRVYGINDRDDIRRFFELYCEHYFHGSEYEFDIYPGMIELITDATAAGMRIILATAKPHESATRILDHAGLAQSFEYIAGSKSDGSRQDKIEVLEHAFEAVETDGLSHRIVMIGDRALDVRAARAHGVDSIVVDWGYAPPGELDDCGATHRVATVEQLRNLLLP